MKKAKIRETSKQLTCLATPQIYLVTPRGVPTPRLVTLAVEHAGHMLWLWAK